MSVLGLIKNMMIPTGRKNIRFIQTLSSKLKLLEEGGSRVCLKHGYLEQCIQIGRGRRDTIS